MISWQAATELSGAAVRAELAGREPITVRVRGNSMRPLLRHGDLVRLRRLRNGEPRLGDVVAVEADSGLVLHRVTRTDHDRVQTRGDAAGRPDEPVARQSILGLANAVETRAGVWLPLVGGRALGAALRALHRLRSRLP